MTRYRSTGWVIAFLLFFVPLTSALHAQDINNQNQLERDGYQVDPNMRVNKDSTNVEIKTPAPRLYQWVVTPTLGNIVSQPVDTLLHLFQNSNYTDGLRGHYNYLGNMGSPRINRIVMDRTSNDQLLFLDPYSFYLRQPWEIPMTNSNIPYSNLTYYRAGDKVNGEENFKAYFSVNATKDLAFGMRFNYLFGRGYYANQATKEINATAFASYTGERYQLHFILTDDDIKVNENGGITDDRYITDPQEMSEGKASYETMNIPTNMSDTWNYNHATTAFLTHRYNLGFTKRVLLKKGSKEYEEALETEKFRKEAEEEARKLEEQKMKESGEKPTDRNGLDKREDAKEPLEPRMMGDSIDSSKPLFKSVYVPVTSFIHTAEVRGNIHRFVSTNEDTDQYDNTYVDYQSLSNDRMTATMIRNTFGINLMEGFNKYAKAGLSAYVTHRINKYSMMSTTENVRDEYNQQEVFVGGELRKSQGTILHYTVRGEVGAAQDALGQFNVTGDADVNLPLWGDTLTFKAHAEVKNELAPFTMRHYHGTHFWWDNEDLDKVFTSKIKGELLSTRLGTHLSAGLENIKNYTYFAADGMPAQYTGDLQIAQATFEQNFQFGIFHLDNEVTYQKSSQQDILPVPDLNLYHNFYLRTKLFKKVLDFELGVDVRYFSKYYAPAYIPGIGNFALQSDMDKVEVGGYPFINLYANMNLKTVRIFAMFYHINQSNGEYFLTPHYPTNQMLFKFGLSWNFYD